MPKVTYFKDFMMVESESSDSPTLLISIVESKLIYGNKILPDVFSGKIVVDSLLRTFNKPNRFVEYFVDNGRPIMDSKRVIDLTESMKFRNISDTIFVEKFPGLIEKSLLPSKLKNDLLNGVTI
ncbi:MAG: type II toxin-antitoxin system RnlB family antitoxin [Weissella confusa]